MIEIVERELRIVAYDDCKTVKRFDVTGQSERQIDKLDRGVNINLNHEQFFTVVCDKAEPDGGEE